MYKKGQLLVSIDLYPEMYTFSTIRKYKRGYEIVLIDKDNNEFVLSDTPKSHMKDQFYAVRRDAEIVELLSYNLLQDMKKNLKNEYLEKIKDL